MEKGDYEVFSDVIERLNMEGIIRIASTGDIILLVEGWTIVTRINSLMEGINDMILRWLKDKVEPEPGSVPPSGAVMERGEQPRRVDGTVKSGSSAIFLGSSENESEGFWSPGKLNNGHFIIIGGSGAGKTETIRCIASELDKERFPVLMIDFHGDMACQNCNIKTYDIKEDSKYYFNPLELNPKFEELTPLRASSDFVDALSINFPTLGEKQKDSIKEIIRKTYQGAGITNKKTDVG